MRLLIVIQWLHLDLLIASASAGVLLYSGRLPISTARLHPEDIIAYKTVPGYGASVGLAPSGLMVPYMVFPEDQAKNTIGEIMDGKIGFDLLVVGTIGSVLAVIAASTHPVVAIPSYPSSGNILLAAIVGWKVGPLPGGRRGVEVGAESRNCG